MTVHREAYRPLWTEEARPDPISLAAIPGVRDGQLYRQVPLVLPKEFRCPNRSAKVKRRKVRRQA